MEQARIESVGKWLGLLLSALALTAAALAPRGEARGVRVGRAI